MRNRFLLALVFLAFIAAGATKLEAVTGPAPTPPEDPEGNTGALKSQVQTGGSYDAHSGNATRIVNDLHVPGALGDYGLDFTRYWNSIPNEVDSPYAEWSMDFARSGWSHSWKWTAVESDEPTYHDDGEQTPEIYATVITITFPDGHASRFKITRTNMPVVPGGWADPRYGPPYIAAHHELSWGSAGLGAHDYLEDMAVDGLSFWLHRADGGSVHFTGTQVVGEPVQYKAVEVYDPHGLWTTLQYNSAGYLWKVEQEGGRFLTISWGSLGAGWETPVIMQVDTGGPAAGQSVTYQYQSNLAGPTLAKVVYPNDLGPGQSAHALYFYAPTCEEGRTPGPCTPNSDTLLRYADDPHYAGAMTKIRYAYRGASCPEPHTLPFNPNYFRASEYAIASENSGETGAYVSAFGINCLNGTREEYNGFDARRKFYFGYSAGQDPGQNNYHCLGFQLAKLTDFSFGPSENAPSDWQNYMNGHPREIWDGRRNMTVSFYLDPSGSPSEVHYADGSTCIYDRIDESGSEGRDSDRVHNPNHVWLFKKKDERDQYTRYFRDARRRVKRIEYPDNSFEEFTYNNFNQVLTHLMPSGTTQHYDYDGFQRLWREWNNVDGEANFTKYEYDALERVALVQNPLARSRDKAFSAKMEYNGRHLVTKVTYPATGSGNDPFVTYQYDKYGNCTAIIDELGYLKAFGYDSYRRCTSYAEQAGSSADCNNVPFRWWNWIYDRVIAGDSVPTRAASAHTSREWRIQIEPEFNAAHQRRATSRVFDANNRMVSEETGLVQNPGESLGTLHAVDVTETHHVTYDENGQKSSFTDEFHRLTEYVYNTRNWLWKTIEYPMPGSTETVRTTETLYNRAGNKTQVKFPDDKIQQWPDYGYDAFGQPRVFIDERQHTTNMEYWPWGPMKKLQKVTTHRTTDNNGPEDQETKFYYDLMGRPQTTTFPDTTTELSVYEFGQLSTFKTRRDQYKHLHYDARGREDGHTWDSQAAPEVRRLWDDANRLTKIWNSYSIIDYSYDEAGQVSAESTTVTGSGGPREVRYCRYPGGEVSRVTYPDNATVVNRNYTAQGQLERASWGGGSVDYTYLRDGKLDHEAYGNGVRSDLGYNGRGFINLTNTYLQSSPVQTYAKRDYWRDERDRIKGWRKGNDWSANPLENGRGDRYDYDEEGELKLASYEVDNPMVGGEGAQRADSFQYDELGNRVRGNYIANRGAMDLKRRDSNGLNQYQSWENAHPSPDPLHWGSDIYHDDNWGTSWVPPGNGVTIADGWITAAYNALNQPVAMGNIAYGNNYMWFWYDPLGRCVKRWLGTGNQTPVGPITYFYYDGWDLIQEGSTAVAADSIYVHGNRVDEIVASLAEVGWLYHHYDARGNCILQTNAGGGLQEQYDYDAFGWPYFYTAAGASVPQSPSGNRFLFTGREFLSDMRIYDYRNRMYQPELGRFLQPDPKQFGAGDYNLYRYCHNDPVNKSDPNGLMSDGYTTPQEIQALHDDPKTPSIIIAVGLGALAAPVLAEEAGVGLLSVASRVPLVARLLGMGGAGAASQANKLNHIFGNEQHNLGGVVRALGSEQKAFNAIQNATQAAVNSQGLSGKFEATVKVGGQAVTVTGKVIDNVARIGTAYVKRVNE